MQETTRPEAIQAGFILAMTETVSQILGSLEGKGESGRKETEIVMPPSSLLLTSFTFSKKKKESKIQRLNLQLLDFNFSFLSGYITPLLKTHQ